MKNKIFIILLLIFCIPAILSLFSPGFFQSDDGEWMVIRFSAFHQSLRDGQFPVRLLGRLNNGQGYPVANFLYPGFMYMGEPIHILGFNFVDTIKIILGFSMVGSAIFTYLWLSKIFNKYAAFIGSLFYLYTPYHLYDLYKRGSVGEVLAFCIVPFILWMLERKSIFFTSVGIFLLIISHNTLALLFLPILLIYTVLRKIWGIKFIIFSFAMGILMSSFFTIPSIYELSYIRFSSISISTATEYFSSINLTGVSSFITLFLSIIIYVIYLRKNKQKKMSNLFALFVFLAIFGIFFSSQVSLIFWQIIPSSLIQFPFRLLSYLVLSMSFLAACVVAQLEGYKKYLISIFLVIILAFSSVQFIKPSEFFDKGDAFYSTNEGTTTVRDEYMPIWVKVAPKERYQEKIEILEGNGVINNLKYGSKEISFSAIFSSDSKIRVNTIYYPGWKAYINGEATNINYDNDGGVMELLTTKGLKNVKIVFSETSLRLFSGILTILSFLVLIFVVVRQKRVKAPK
ncbi:MAG: 6-pyruvoyl-tetrahydropterin synthase-related protein [Patescibacteria group bacterium]|nr:6-pyruvoyl-tetrahydropterin synthase-related protein [Patescibacteria group bacterium]